MDFVLTNRRTEPITLSIENYCNNYVINSFVLIENEYTGVQNPHCYMHA